MVAVKVINRNIPRLDPEYHVYKGICQGASFIPHALVIQLGISSKLKMKTLSILSFINSKMHGMGPRQF